MIDIGNGSSLTRESVEQIAQLGKDAPRGTIIATAVVTMRPWYGYDNYAFCHLPQQGNFWHDIDIMIKMFKGHRNFPKTEGTFKVNLNFDATVVSPMGIKTVSLNAHPIERILV